MKPTLVWTRRHPKRPQRLYLDRNRILLTEGDCAPKPITLKRSIKLFTAGVFYENDGVDFEHGFAEWTALIAKQVVEPGARLGRKGGVR